MQVSASISGSQWCAFPRLSAWTGQVDHREQAVAWRGRFGIIVLMTFHLIERPSDDRSSAGLLGIRLNTLRRRLVEKDKRQRIAGLSRYIAAQARYRSRHATDVLRNHLAEAIALDGHLLSGFDFVVEPYQMLDEPGLGCQNRERTVAHKNIQVPACSSHRPGEYAVMFEDVHS